MAAEPDELRERLRATREAAARLAERLPGDGWPDAAARAAAVGEVRVLVDVAQALRALVPEDLAEQVREILLGLLLLLRAILDLAVEHLAAPPAEPAPPTGPDVQDIPIS